jgi:hypothetical protein
MPTFDVPGATEAITLDGSCREKSWQSAFHSRPFADAKDSTTPHTDLRALADDSNLYLALDVADVDIEPAGDRVQLDIGLIHVVATPQGGTGPVGVKIASTSRDKAWTSEVAVPWSLLKRRTVPMRALRFDVNAGAPVHTLAWPDDGPGLLRFADKAGKPEP